MVAIINESNQVAKNVRFKVREVGREVRREGKEERHYVYTISHWLLGMGKY